MILGTRNRCRAAALATAGALVGGVSLLGFALPAYAANGVEPVTFTVAGGVLALAETPDSGTALIPGTPTDMPVTTVTDGRNDGGRSGAWTATNAASDLTETGGGVIASANIAMGEATASFTGGSGIASVTAGSVAVTADTINSVYTYTPTADLTVPANATAGNYTGTVTQTVL
jgi:hypothetical protein